MKRFILCITSVLLLTLVLLSPVSAAEDISVEQILIDSCTYGTKADISRFQLTAEALDSIIYDLRNSGQLPWYAQETYGYSYNETTGIVVEFEPTVLDTDVYSRSRYEQRIAEILSECVLEGMEDWQIALSIHDYLVVNCIYDEALNLRTGYDLLVKGSTVCSGYAAAYQDLLNRAGVPCVSVISEPMEHAWNLVQIGGQWYHVDVTWDDPTPDMYGYVSHKYFLVTDAEISAGDDPHYDWKTDITCTDARFADAYWREVDSRICFTSSQTCYLLRHDDWNNQIYRRNETSGEETLLYTDEEDYVNIGHGNYTYLHRGLSYWNGRLYFCSLDEIMSIATDGSDLHKLYQYDTRKEGRYLAGCHIVNDTAYIAAGDHDGNTVPHTAKLKATGYHAHSYTETVQAPSCQEPGFTLSACSCGLTAQSTPIKATGHSYQQTESKAATLFADGFSTEKCSSCGNTQTRTLPQLGFLSWLQQLPEGVVRLVLSGIALVVVLIFAKRKKKH